MKRIVLIMTLAFVCNCTANSQTKKASTRSSSTVSIDDADGVKKEEYVIDGNDSTIFFKIENSQLMFLKINGDKIPTADYARYMPLVNAPIATYKIECAPNPSSTTRVLFLTSRYGDEILSSDNQNFPVL